MTDSAERRSVETTFKWQSYAEQDAKSLEQWREQATRDPITGLLNKNWWTNYGEKIFTDLITHHRPFTFLWFDLNYLGLMNDMLSEPKVDQVLGDIGNVFLDKKQGFRAKDAVIRVHGDTFAVIMPNTSIEAAKNAVFRVLKNVEALGGKYGLPPSFSVGIVGDSSDAFPGPNELLEAAAIACSHAKVRMKQGQMVGGQALVLFEKGMQQVEHKKI